MDVERACAYDIRNELQNRGLSAKGNLKTIRERLRADIDARSPIAYEASGMVTRRRAAAARVTASPATVVAPAISMTRTAARTVNVTRVAAVVVTTTTITEPTGQTALTVQIMTATAASGATVSPTLPVPVESHPAFMTRDESPHTLPVKVESTPDSPATNSLPSGDQSD